MNNITEKKILLVSLPRSGSSWIATILANAENSYLVYEPDNIKVTLRAIFLKKYIKVYPFLKADDKEKKYYKLFNFVFNDLKYPKNICREFLHINGQKVLRRLTGKRSVQLFRYSEGNPKIKIVKSVHCGLALEFLMGNFEFQPVILLRHPASLARSFLSMDLIEAGEDFSTYKGLFEDFGLDQNDTGLKNIKSSLNRIGFKIGLFYSYFSRMIEKYPGIILIRHEDFLDDPENAFAELYAKLGLNWSTRVTDFIHSTDNHGTGFQINRERAKEKDKWRGYFSESQLDEIKTGYRVLSPELYKDFK